MEISTRIIPWMWLFACTLNATGGSGWQDVDGRHNRRAADNIDLQYVGYHPVWREDEDSVKKAILLTDPTQVVQTEGVLIQWNMFTSRSRRSQKLYFQVWRPSDPNVTPGEEGARHEYRLVGQTLFAALWPEESNIMLYPEDRIHVQPGDTIGIYFPKYNPIPWTPVTCHKGNRHLFKYNPTSPSTNPSRRGRRSTSSPSRGGMFVTLNTTLVFDEATKDWKPCRRYSYNATIVTHEEASKLDMDYDDVTDSRYLKRPYGPYIPTGDDPITAVGAGGGAYWSRSNCISSSLYYILMITSLAALWNSR